jgi:hypothetical protein
MSGKAPGLSGTGNSYNSDRIWCKSTYSMANGHCVEVAHLPGSAVGVRDSKDADGPVLVFGPDAWSTFLNGIRVPRQA